VRREGIGTVGKNVGGSGAGEEGGQVAGRVVADNRRIARGREARRAMRGVGAGMAVYSSVHAA